METKQLLMLGAFGLGVYWLINKATASAATPTAHPSALPPNESVVVTNDPFSRDEFNTILRGSFVNGLGGLFPHSYAGGNARAVSRGGINRWGIVNQGGSSVVRGSGGYSLGSKSAAMPVSMRENAPVNDQWSPSVPVTPNRPTMKSQQVAWQEKELAYMRANPGATSGGWIHNPDGTVQRATPQPVPNKAPSYYAGAYQGTAEQVARARKQYHDAGVPGF